MRWIILPLAIAIAPVQALPAHAAGTSSADGLGYVFMTGNHGDNIYSHNTDDYDRAQTYRAGNAPLLYVRQHGIAYVIRDPAILSRAEAIVAPQRELGRRQGALGEQQGELGRRQGELGAEQGRLGARMADSTPRQMGELGRRQGELGRQQAELGAQQGALGRRQAELGNQQAELAKRSEPQFGALLAEAIRRGLAQRVD